MEKQNGFLRLKSTKSEKWDNFFSQNVCRKDDKNQYTFQQVENVPEKVPEKGPENGTENLKSLPRKIMFYYILHWV